MVHLKNSRPSTMLTKLQQINLLCNSQEFIIMNVDKNLGPCILKRHIYVKSILYKHLNQNEYKSLDKETVLKNINLLRSSLTNITKEIYKKTPKSRKQPIKWVILFQLRKLNKNWTLTESYQRKEKKKVMSDMTESQKSALLPQFDGDEEKFELLWSKFEAYTTILKPC